MWGDSNSMEAADATAADHRELRAGYPDDGSSLCPNRNTTSNTTASQSTPTQSQSLPLEIKQKLEKQGFTNVQVVPGSFIVSAKDKDGDPVNMLIGPNSMMVMTTSPVSASTNQGQAK